MGWTKGFNVVPRESAIHGTKVFREDCIEAG
jgi:hypothetical protein